MAKYGRSAQVKSAYTQMVEVGRDTRANHGYDCNASHATLDAMVDEALFNYGAAIEHASDHGR